MQYQGVAARLIGTATLAVSRKEKEMGKDKFGEGPSKKDLVSPIHVGPKQGQEGWTPANPTLPKPRDPLGYTK